MQTKNAFTVNDHSVTGETFSIKKHPRLKVLATEPVPENLGIYYKSEDYISHSDASKSLFEKLYQWVKKYSLNKKLRLLERYTSGKGKLLDYGAGTGAFVQQAIGLGWEATGVEPSEAARKRAAEKGISLMQSWDDFVWEDFEVITLWHVLEHLPDLEGSIAQIKQLLKPNGMLVLALPNFKSWDAVHYGSYWAGYDVPRHLWHFSREAVEELFIPFGFELLKTHPLYFDAFYVSLLSEKYRSGKMRWAPAIYNGLRSNLSAMTSGEYSSLIYVLKKN
ncbi:class I SAM-dependent methyltransferase [Lentiprolixibacter aurantiacus]|uniref:Class I SAM-dependent methyltransferase n=1 Tax=Lentiprolixibacter aurantiacus TaxID=2993939 RepID=A0AAE3MIW6_9FLAO|nr:class I SAM-dependent methyltransferase [Lentiprolixibacter aurantiacus]MCX2718520.1 class I SAM-dependent methyltransferase [Lentiprolixibacter aurantiacus]